MRILRWTALFSLVLSPLLSHAQSTSAPSQTTTPAQTTVPSQTSAPSQTTGNQESGKQWIAKSNRDAQVLLQIDARYSPEYAGRTGVAGLDEQVTQLPPDRREKIKADWTEAIQELQHRLAAENDPLVREDLQIMIKAAQQRVRGEELSEKYEMPYMNITELVFRGVRALLDDQVAEGRRKNALVRLRKYTGMEPGFEPIASQAKARTMEWTKPGQIGPPKVEVETDLARVDFYINGIGQLFEKYKIEGYQEPYARLKQQLADYNNWLREQVLPKARADFRLPPEEYAFRLEAVGVDIPADQLTAMAHREFTAYQQEMQQLAPQIAKQHGWKVTDYRDVIRELKKDQLVGDAILPHYQQRLKDIEAIIQREHLATLPDRPARIRLATPAETVEQPAPHMMPPPLLNNHGEQGEFILPLNVPTAAGSAQTKKMDDFTFAASSWTLTAHEARPGHELQFDSMVERGVSLARSLYAFNSVNVEGWGLYAEYITKPYMPPDGQLISLQLRLQRAARAFIDPELQSGKLKPEDAMRILTHDVMLSDAFANTEVERYTFRMPGQATSYFYGYIRLLQLRKDVEAKMGKNFNQQKYHDFILAQGLLPPDLLRKAVMEDFVGH